MDSQTLIAVISRWLHVGAAIVMFGGTLFQFLVLMPAARELPDDERKALHGRVIGRWRKIVMAMIGLLLLSGFYNYLAVAIPAHRESPTKGLYHMLMGIKILLALGVFFLASALVGRSPAFEGIRAQARKWMMLVILLAAAVVAIGGYLKVAVPSAPRVQQPASVPAG